MRHATFQQVRVFEAVARNLSFSRAARELGMTQPAVSGHVRQLEGHAGLVLFEQLGRRVYLTRAGEEMLRHCRAILQQFREVDESMAAMKGVRGGRLDVGVISAGGYFIPGLLAEFTRRHPGVTVRLDVNNRAEIVRELAENTTDLAVLLHPPEREDTVAEPFAPQRHVIVAAPGHPLAAKRAIALRSLAAEPFIVRERGSDTRLVLDEVLHAERLAFSFAMEVASTATIKESVIAGIGIGFLSTHAIGQEVALGRLAVLDVKGFPVVRQWHVAHLRAKRLPPVAVAFKEFLLRDGEALIERVVGHLAQAEGDPARGGPGDQTPR